MITNIFIDAFELYQSGYVYFLSGTDKAMRFMAKDVEVRMEVTPTGTRFQCQCPFHQNHQLQDKMCKRIIAVIVYCYFRRKHLGK